MAVRHDLQLPACTGIKALPEGVTNAGWPLLVALLVSANDAVGSANNMLMLS